MTAGRISQHRKEALLPASVSRIDARDDAQRKSYRLTDIAAMNITGTFAGIWATLPNRISIVPARAVELPTSRPSGGIATRCGGVSCTTATGIRDAVSACNCARYLLRQVNSMFGTTRDLPLNGG
jgi:hypothetical protein